MLTLTDSAVEVVRDLVEAAPIDEDGGIRIYPGETGAAGTRLEIAVVAGPERSDASVDAGGAHVFLEPMVAEFLDDKVLDVETGDAGPSFTIKPQPDVGVERNGRPPAA